MRKKVTLRVDAEIVEIAKDIDLNTSKTVKNALEEGMPAKNGGTLGGPGGTFDPSKDFRTRVLLSASRLARGQPYGCRHTIAPRAC